jgi:hypothetical protein
MFLFLMNLLRSTAYTGVLWIQVGDQALGSFKILFIILPLFLFWHSSISDRFNLQSEMQMITIPAKRNQSEVGRSLSRDCSSEIDLNTSQHSDIENYSNKSMLDGSLTYDTEMSCEEGGDVGTRYGSEPTSVCEDCSTSWSNQCENTRALLRIRSHMNSEGNKRKRWCGRTAEMDCLPRISFANSESGTNPIEDKYEIALALKELVSRGMAAEAFSEISTMDPDFFTQNPGLLFHLKQVEFLKLVSAGDHNGALKVACFHLGPLAANDQSLLKTLKETLLVLLQPDGTAPGKDLPLNDLANTLQVTMFLVLISSSGFVSDERWNTQLVFVFAILF